MACNTITKTDFCALHKVKISIAQNVFHCTLNKKPAHMVHDSEIDLIMILSEA